MEFISKVYEIVHLIISVTFYEFKRLNIKKMVVSVASVGIIMDLRNNPISTQVNLQQELLEEVISSQDKYFNVSF